MLNENMFYGQNKSKFSKLLAVSGQKGLYGCLPSWQLVNKMNSFMRN